MLWQFNMVIMFGLIYIGFGSFELNVGLLVGFVGLLCVSLPVYCLYRLLTWAFSCAFYLGFQLRFCEKGGIWFLSKLSLSGVMMF